MKRTLALSVLLSGVMMISMITGEGMPPYAVMPVQAAELDSPYPMMITAIRIGLVTKNKVVRFAVWQQGGVYIDNKLAYSLVPEQLYSVEKGFVTNEETGASFRLPEDRRATVGAADHRINVNGAWYRGCLELINHGTTVTAINLLDLEEYLVGVLPRVVPATLEPETLKAAAVVLRSFANDRMGKIEDCKENGFDFAPDMPGLEYGGLDAERPQTLNAVQQTRGIVLKGTGSLRPLRFNDKQDAKLNLLRTNVSTQTLERLTGVTNIDTVTVEKMDPNGEAHDVLVAGSSDKRSVYGAALAKSLSLPNAAILEAVKASDHWVFVCRGSQAEAGLDLPGANLLASNNWRFDQILQHYFQSNSKKLIGFEYMPNYRAVRQAQPAGAIVETQNPATVSVSKTPQPENVSSTSSTTMAPQQSQKIDQIPSDPTTRAARNSIRDKWALVVGISKFKDPNVSLTYAAKDAADFAQYLVGYAGFKADHVKVLTDEQATRDKIFDQLGKGWLGHLARPEDLVVVYVSSHGTAVKRDLTGVNFLIAHDTDPDNILGTGITMEWICQIIKEETHSDRILLLLDVCHSEAGAQGAKGLRREAEFDSGKILLNKGQMIIASSGSEQESWESKNYPNSVFTRRLIEGLKVNGRQTTISQAFGYLKDKVQEEVLKDRAQLQTPVMRSFGLDNSVILSAPVVNTP